ncbi:MAG: MBL fold metallo-hydrolase [Puniceicoccales bacterium]|nr:MBL fold metallo-hydrolase [Puniceicoccales bacterium]
MHFTDLCRRREIGAHCVLVEIGSFHILVDSGMDPGSLGMEALPLLDCLEGVALDLILITHCHLDHIGSLPILMRRQPQARILISPPSQTLIFPMLENSWHVMKRQREELGVKVYPLYTKGEIETLREHFYPMPLGATRIFQKQGDEVAIQFIAAGHIPGAASVLLQHGRRKLFFSGDVLFRDQYILKGANWSKEPIDTLVMETTRGNAQRPEDQTVKSEIARLLGAIDEVLEQKGSVLIPSFALGRLQEVLMILQEARRYGKISKKIPIFASGLGMSLVDPLDQLSEQNREILFKKQVIDELHVQSLDSSPLLKPGRNPKRSSIFVVSSGMMAENTPSYNIAASLLAHPQNGIFFVGFCADDTPARKLRDTPKGEVFSFEGLRYKTPVRARIEHFDLSGHADREELLQAALHMSPRTIILNHGDGGARQWFADRFAELAPKIRILDPDAGVTYAI